MFLVDDIVNAIGGANAASEQEQQIKNAQAGQQAALSSITGYLSPYNTQGQTSLGQLMGRLNGGFSPQNLASDPGYQFRLQQAQQALQRGMSSRGMLGSGAFAKGMDDYTQGLASQQYQQAFNNWNTINGGLAGIAGMGANAGSTLGSLTQQNANSMSHLYGDLGNAQAAGTQAIYGGISSGIRDVGNAVMMGATGGLSGLTGFGGGGGYNAFNTPNMSAAIPMQ